MSDLIRRLQSLEAVDGNPHEIEQLTDEAASALETANSRLAELETERDAFRTQATLNQHMVITCGVAASHPDPNLSRTGAYASAWNSEQANKVRALRDDRDRLRARVAELEVLGIAGQHSRPPWSNWSIRSTSVSTRATC
jgi:hypothetical protein